jgi:hypothetical protein
LGYGFFFLAQKDEGGIFAGKGGKFPIFAKKAKKIRFF